MKGYGHLIASARTQKGWTPEELARRLGYKTKTVVYRLEAEQQEPTADLINRLVRVLPITLEDLLTAMGIEIRLPEAAKLPPALVCAWPHLAPEHREIVERIARELHRPPQPTGQP